MYDGTHHELIAVHIYCKTMFVMINLINVSFYGVCTHFFK